jgi:hypothetical protein
MSRLGRGTTALLAVVLAFLGGAAPVSAQYPGNIDQIKITVNDANRNRPGIDAKCGIRTNITIIAYRSTAHGRVRVRGSWIHIELRRSRGTGDKLGPDMSSRLTEETITNQQGVAKSQNKKPWFKFDCATTAVGKRVIYAEARRANGHVVASARLTIKCNVRDRCIHP